MINYKEIIRLHELGLNNTRIAEGCGCARSTVISTLRYAAQKGLDWKEIHEYGGTNLTFEAARFDTRWRNSLTVKGGEI